MNPIVVDTNVVSYIFKRHPIGVQYLPVLADRTPILSFMTIAELERWVIDAHWGAERIQRLREYLENFVVLPFDRELCRVWAKVTVGASAAGRRIECADAWIAATAVICGAPLVTHNRADYLGVPNLQLISHGT